MLDVAVSSFSELLESYHISVELSCLIEPLLPFPSVTWSADLVMVVVDHGLMKGVIYCPCTKNIDAAGVAQLFFAHVFPQFSHHSKVISDRGLQFASVFA